MSIVNAKQINQKKASSPEDSSRKKALKERADRFSLRRAFETVREMHELPQKILKPK